MDGVFCRHCAAPLVAQARYCGACGASAETGRVDGHDDEPAPNSPFNLHSATAGGTPAVALATTAAQTAEAATRPLGSGYVLLDVIGRGAMGEVWRARTRAGEDVAVKVLRAGLADDPELVTRFLREREILTRLNHPNLVHVRDLVAEGSTLAIVMDLVPGPNLRQVLRTPGTLPPAMAGAAVLDVLHALAAAHVQGVVHRDVKPENVLLAEQDPVLARLTDFGIARLNDADPNSRLTGAIGTPEYMPAEILAGEAATQAVDVYAAGVVLYELLCGITPFAGGNTIAVLRRAADQPPGRPGGLPSDLWQLLAWMLQKQPALRPTSTAAAAALESLLPVLEQLPQLPRLLQPPAPEPENVMATMMRPLSLPPTVDGIPTAPGTPSAGIDFPTPGFADHASAPLPAQPRQRVVTSGRVLLAVAIVLLSLVAGAGLATMTKPSGTSNHGGAPVPTTTVHQR
ncbi:MAG: hypothetical protein QG597_4398 [Actinomycetota bacterium]|nr:hypothetical protein [Actinomycetota bacterium]